MMMEIVFLASIIVLVSQTFTSERIFEDVRLYIAKRFDNDLLSYFIQCSYCFSVWVMAILSLWKFKEAIVAWLIAVIILRYFKYVQNQ